MPDTDNPPTPPAPDVPPTPPPAPENPPPPVPPAPDNGASKEVLDAVKGLTEIVTKLVNKDAGIPPDQTPVKRPWTAWGSKR